MENRKKPANPVPQEPVTTAKPDDFEPEVTGLGPQPVDRPTSPPCESYDCGVQPPSGT